MKLTLSKKQRKELLSELQIERERKFADRLRVILLLDEGRKYQDIATFLFLDEKTILNWKNRYQEGGLERLVNDHYVGRTGFMEKDQLDQFEKHLDSKILPTTRAAILFVKRQFGVFYTAGGMTSLLHRLGFSYKKPKGVPAKANPVDQRQFLTRYYAAKAKGSVYFADSTHPMLNPVLSSGWIRKGRDVQIKTNSGRQRLNINGAVEISKQDIITRTCATVDQKSMCELLRAIRRKNLDKKNLYLVLDNAAYNRAKSVQNLSKKLEIKLLYLPPYSPNLNIIERLWKFMKKKVLANHHYESLAQFKASISTFFRNIWRYWDELKTLLTDNFQIMKA